MEPNESMTPFNVVAWNFNRKRVEYYDVMPYLMEQYERFEPLFRPSTPGAVKAFIREEAKYRYWSRCEYEIVVTGFPQNGWEKIDVYDQIEANIDAIVLQFMANARIPLRDGAASNQ